MEWKHKRIEDGRGSYLFVDEESAKPVEAPKADAPAAAAPAGKKAKK